MTGSLPPEVREAFQRFITCEYVTIDAQQQPIVWPVTPYYGDGATVGRRHDRAGLSEEGQRRPSQPPGGAALLRPDRLRDQQRAPGARSGNGRRRRPGPDGQPGALLARVLGEAPGHAGACIRRSILRGMLRLVLHADLRPRSPGAGLRVAPTATSARRLSASGRTWRRCDPATARSRSSRSSRPRAAACPGMGESRSSAAATRRPCSSWVAPDGFPLAVRLPVSADRAPGGSSSTPARGPAVGRRAAPA